MRFFIAISLIVASVICFLIWRITGSVRDFNVTVINRVAILPDGDSYYITQSPVLSYVDGELMTVPKGFKTDLATIPRLLYSLVYPAQSNIITSSIIHDYLYTCPGNISRLDADSIFYHALIYDGAPQYIAVNMFLAVRLFGHSKFNYKVECYPNDDGDWQEWIPVNLKLD